MPPLWLTVSFDIAVHEFAIPEILTVLLPVCVCLYINARILRIFCYGGGFGC